jgi:hypothetical protein
VSVLDVSTPATPVEVTSLDTGGSAYDVCKSGSFLFVADGTAGVRVVNVANPAAPFESGYYDTSDRAVGVFAEGPYVYAASSRGGLYVLDYDEFAAVTVAGFTAAAVETGVRLDWSVEADEPVSGFRILRVAGGGGQVVSVTGGQLIPPDRTSYVDATVSPGVVYRYTLVVVKPDGSEVVSRTVTVLPAARRPVLYQNYPNPFNPSTTIGFVLPEKTRVSLSIFDVRGGLVKTLADGPMERGLKQVVWDGTNRSGEPAGSGIYFYRLKAGKITTTRKMLLVK